MKYLILSTGNYKTSPSTLPIEAERQYRDSDEPTKEGSLGCYWYKDIDGKEWELYDYQVTPYYTIYQKYIILTDAQAENYGLDTKVVHGFGHNEQIAHTILIDNYNKLINNN